MSLGNLSINFSGCPEGPRNVLRDCLQTLISTLVPKSYTLPLTLQNLCELKFAPKKDYVKNKLDSGLFQVKIFGKKYLI
jgi:hypothetical protein